MKNRHFYDGILGFHFCIYQLNAEYIYYQSYVRLQKFQDKT